MESYSIRKAKENEWEDAMSLAWRTFEVFESPIYSARGRESFLEFISSNELYSMFRNGDYKLFLAIEKSKIIGLISLRARTHISLLFVDEKYHKKGIGRELIKYAAMFVREEYKEKSMTVNAAPGATGFYHKIGFKDMGAEAYNDGITYFPMKYNFES